MYVYYLKIFLKIHGEKFSSYIKNSFMYFNFVICGQFLIKSEKIQTKYANNTFIIVKYSKKHICEKYVCVINKYLLSNL